MDIMTVQITALYAGLLALIGFGLTMPIGMLRVKNNVSILHGDNMELAVAIRRHGNFIEYVPLALVMMAIVELNGATANFMHGVGIALVVGRLLHPIGLNATNPKEPLRGIGAFLTAGVILALAVKAMLQFFG